MQQSRSCSAIREEFEVFGQGIAEDELGGFAALAGVEVAEIAAPGCLLDATRDCGFVQVESIAEL